MSVFEFEVSLSLKNVNKNWKFCTLDPLKLESIEFSQKQLLFFSNVYTFCTIWMVKQHFWTKYAPAMTVLKRKSVKMTFKFFKWPLQKKPQTDDFENGLKSFLGPYWS